MADDATKVNDDLLNEAVYTDFPGMNLVERRLAASQHFKSMPEDAQNKLLMGAVSELLATKLDDPFLDENRPQINSFVRFINRDILMNAFADAGIDLTADQAREDRNEEEIATGSKTPPTYRRDQQMENARRALRSTIAEDEDEAVSDRWSEWLEYGMAKKDWERQSLEEQQHLLSLEEKTARYGVLSAVAQRFDRKYTRDLNVEELSNEIKKKVRLPADGSDYSNTSYSEMMLCKILNYETAEEMKAAHPDLVQAFMFNGEKLKALAASYSLDGSMDASDFIGLRDSVADQVKTSEGKKKFAASFGLSEQETEHMLARISAVNKDEMRTFQETLGFSGSEIVETLNINGMLQFARDKGFMQHMTAGNYKDFMDWAILTEAMAIDGDPVPYPPSQFMFKDYQGNDHEGLKKSFKDRAKKYLDEVMDVEKKRGYAERWYNVALIKGGSWHEGAVKKWKELGGKLPETMASLFDDPGKFATAMATIMFQAIAAWPESAAEKWKKVHDAFDEADMTYKAEKPKRERDGKAALAQAKEAEDRHRQTLMSQGQRDPHAMHVHDMDKMLDEVAGIETKRANVRSHDGGQARQAPEAGLMDGHIQQVTKADREVYAKDLSTQISKAAGVKVELNDSQVMHGLRMGISSKEMGGLVKQAKETVGKQAVDETLRAQVLPTLSPDVLADPKQVTAAIDIAYKNLKPEEYAKIAEDAWKKVTAQPKNVLSLVFRQRKANMTSAPVNLKDILTGRGGMAA